MLLTCNIAYPQPKFLPPPLAHLHLLVSESSEIMCAGCTIHLAKDDNDALCIRFGVPLLLEGGENFKDVCF
jgi:hypothetical protein